jgi:hypothetical protein
LGREIIKYSINSDKFHFSGGVGRRCRFYWRFFRLYWRPKNHKKSQKSIKFIEIPGGGSGPKHSAFCGGCFSINPYRALFGQNRSKWTPKNHEPSVFFIPQNWQNSTLFDPHKWYFLIYSANGFRQFYHDPIYKSIFTYTIFKLFIFYYVYHFRKVNIIETDGKENLLNQYQNKFLKTNE